MNKPRLLDQVRLAIRRKHYSHRTEQSYTYWVRYYIRFHKLRHPLEMREDEVKHFLNYLANERKVAASTQNQALCAILFLYREVLEQPLELIKDVDRARRTKNLPVVLSSNEVSLLLEQLNGTYWLLASLLYGTGMRVSEGLRLRVYDIDFDYKQITVRKGKGNKDRVTLLPDTLSLPLSRHLENVKTLHERDLQAGFGCVALPYALRRKYPNAEYDWGWQYVFPSTLRSPDRLDNRVKRFHMSPRTIQNAVRSAARKAKIAKRAGCHTHCATVLQPT